MSQGRESFEIIKGKEPIPELNLKKWENAAPVTYLISKLQGSKKTDSKSDGKLCSVENHELAESKPYKG